MPFNIKKLKTFSYIINNIYHSSGSGDLSKYKKLIYVVEDADWSIKWDGHYITHTLNTGGLMHAIISPTHIGARNQMIHFGSFNTFFHSSGFKKPHRSNKVIVTCFHLVDDDPRLKFIREAESYVDYFHTSCTISKNKLMDSGVKADKIAIIPLGVDLSLFRMFSETAKKKMKAMLGLPSDSLIIGSFQKDGNGWGEGLEPKWVKGPDEFIRIVAEIAKTRKVHCLLTGPARGYMKKGLKAAGVAYTHRYLNNYQDIVSFYNCLDLYLITSREEGGPKALIESMATGIPVLSSKCGMAPDIIVNGKNGFLVETNDYNTISHYIDLLFDEAPFRENIIQAALKTVRGYDWDTIGKQYMKLYKAVTDESLSK